MLRLAALSSRRSAFLPPLRAPLTPILFRSINIKLRTRPPNRDAGLTCFNCKQPGHRATNCPEPVSCHACGGTGHIARACPNPDPERIRTCRRCGSRDHFVQDCTQPRACYRCGSLAHLASDCSQPWKPRPGSDASHDE